MGLKLSMKTVEVKLFSNCHRHVDSLVSSLFQGGLIYSTFMRDVTPHFNNISKSACRELIH